MHMTNTVLDHVAIGTSELTDGWELFGGVLGGTWVYGGDATGFWWGQLQFGAGPKIELITPTGGPDSAFLERFLASRGPGAHHLNFVVTDIRATLSRVRALGIEPVGVSLLSATWKEAFLHPKDAHGIVVQVAEQSGPPPEIDPPAELGQPGPASAFAVVEHHVADIENATRLFQEALEGEIVGRTDGEATSTEKQSRVELTWPNGARLRLVQAAPESDNPEPGRKFIATRLRFDRDGAAVSTAELSRARDLCERLGVTVELVP
jgi:methylmalonyl-CoA/ethylmalonyl-CoA epimerase